jgi:hypothetical protein
MTIPANETGIVKILDKTDDEKEAFENMSKKVIENNDIAILITGPDVNDYLEYKARRKQMEDIDHLKLDEGDDWDDINNSIGIIGMPDEFYGTPQAADFMKLLTEETPDAVKLGIALLIRKYSMLAKWNMEDLVFKMKADINHNSPEFQAKLADMRRKSDEQKKLVREKMKQMMD